jgi:hypothetical protein
MSKRSNEIICRSVYQQRNLFKRPNVMDRLTAITGMIFRVFENFGKIGQSLLTAVLWAESDRTFPVADWLAG